MLLSPIIVKAASGITVGLLGWLYLVGYLPKPKPVVRGTGVFLQLVGFILAAYGLERTLEKFGLTPSTSRILPWMEDFWNIFDTSRTVSLSGTGLAEASGNVSLEVKRGFHLPQSKAERLRKLEQEVQEMKDELKGVRDEVSNEIERLEDTVKEEVEAVEEEVEEMRETMKEVNVGEGALWIEWGAVFSFVYGVPLASFPSSFLPAYRVLIIPIVAGILLGSLHWYAD